ncbi:MAG: site-specific DNA-methyltransferase [Candidatus Sungbacteria bacterium]|nr:site-specific DNA-methyltransferase [Candidatus Sungbacteria bacterium]
MEINKVYNGNCFELINQLDDESIDLIVCDVWGDIKQLTYKSKELISRDVLNTIQKPIKLIERIVKASSSEGDIVLDPFAGVGTTFVVCKGLKRNFIGFEMNLDFVPICNKRIRLDRSSNQISHVGFSENWTKSNSRIVYQDKGTRS